MRFRQRRATSQFLYHFARLTGIGFRPRFQDGTLERRVSRKWARKLSRTEWARSDSHGNGRRTGATLVPLSLRPSGYLTGTERRLKQDVLRTRWTLLSKSWSPPSFLT